MKSRFALVGRLSAQDLEQRSRFLGVCMGRTRIVVARAIAEAPAVFDFDMVFARARALEPRIARGTVYLLLRRLRDADLIRVVGETAASARVSAERVGDYLVLEG